MDSKKLLKLKVSEAVKEIEKIYCRESELIDEGCFEARDLGFHFVPFLFEAAKCLPEHVGFRYPPTDGRCFYNANVLCRILSVASRSDLVEDNGLLLWAREMGQLCLSELTDRAVEHAFSGLPGNWYPVSQIVEKAYAKRRFREGIFDLLWAYNRVTDRGAANAFLSVTALLNRILDDVNSEEQMYRDIIYHRATGELPEGRPFCPEHCEPSIAGLNLF